MRALAVLTLVLALASCDDEPIQVGRGFGATNPAAGTDPSSGAPSAEAEAGAAARPREYSDPDFVEAETNRDPFRNYAASFEARPAEPSTTRPVKLPDTSIEEMRLIAVVSGVANPRAMIVDRLGVGHTVRRGEFLGRPEVVQAGGLEELPITLHWRVDRIRPSEVVLTREDPTAPNRPPLTRLIPLRDEGDTLGLQP